jgi:hypothetical protein
MNPASGLGKKPVETGSGTGFRLGETLISPTPVYRGSLYSSPGIHPGAEDGMNPASGLGKSPLKRARESGSGWVRR